MNWLEEAIQPEPTRYVVSTLSPRLHLDAKGRVVFRVDYTSQGHVVVRVRSTYQLLHSDSYMWTVAQRYEVGNPREHDMAMRAALVRLYTELFEDRCEQTGIPCVNERRKEMKKWLSVTSSQTE